jgi:hypothetical protein
MRDATIVAGPEQRGDGYLHFVVRVGACDLEVLANPHGANTATAMPPDDQTQYQAIAAVSDWLEENPDQAAREFLQAGRKFRASRELLREERLPRLAVLSAREREPGGGVIDLVVRAPCGEVPVVVSGPARIAAAEGYRLVLPEDPETDAESSDDLPGITSLELDAVIESAARYLVEEDRVVRLGGNALTKELLQLFWIFEARSVT